ncbi:MAG: CRISPR system precrRNA processing endoribonuclease RAMP protein Cas6 [Chloroflexi bacterium]|nr:CRISPR system precrRNA processing endoribonuclease RAMP protein Cas6 [Chloroflexota bacterium]
MPSADLAAYVVRLRASRSLTITNHMGRAIQQLALHLVRQVDSTLSESIHGVSQIKPYAVSGLLQPGSTRAVRGRILSGDCAWVRVAGLRTDVVAALDQSMPEPEAEVEIDHIPWKVESVFDNNSEHPWAGRTSYGELIQRYHAAALPDSVQLEFASPTAFSSADLNIPLPDPLRVFDSLHQQWSALIPSAAFALPESLMEFVRHFVPLSEYSAHTEVLTLKTPEVGFCAKQVKFTIKQRVSVGKSVRKNKPEYARTLETLNDQRNDLARAVALLAAFAFYCGIGIKTTTGMGMVRPV